MKATAVRTVIAPLYPQRAGAGRNSNPYPCPDEASREARGPNREIGIVDELRLFPGPPMLTSIQLSRNFNSTGGLSHSEAAAFSPCPSASGALLTPSASAEESSRLKLG